MNKIFLILILFVSVASCANQNNFNDINSLEQKALEIPPNFDLKPPLDEKNESLEDVLNKNNVDSNELEDILGIDDESLGSNTNTDSDLLDILINEPENTTD